MATSTCLVNLLSSHCPTTSVTQKHALQPVSSLSLQHSLKPRTPTSSTIFKAPFSHLDSCRIRVVARASLGETDASSDDPLPMVGEDSAAFHFGAQNIVSWVYFTVILGVVLFILDFVWIDNSTGFGKAFIGAVSSLFDSPECRKVRSQRRHEIVYYPSCSLNSRIPKNTAIHVNLDKFTWRFLSSS